MSERPSPQSIGICALIALYSDPNSPLNDFLLSDRASDVEDGTAKIAAFIEASVIGRCRNAGANTNKRTLYCTGRINDSTSLSRWIQQLYDIDDGDIAVDVGVGVGAGAAQLLLDTLGLAAESVDAIVDLMDSLKGAVHHECLVDADSVNGLYLRQVCLGFDELSFESVTLLWQNFQQEVASCIIHDDNITPRGNDSGINQNPPSWDWPPSTEQLYAMLRRDCVDFGGTNFTRRRSSFEDMELYIRGMIEKEPELPVAYFLRYLNCLRHGERVGALDALHQYFDHAMVQHAPLLSSRRGGGGMSSPVSSDILQFSAILLAMTHSTFGDSELALMATEEAVRVAQQSKDTACVAFALGWLYEHHCQGTVQRRELLERCATRASAAGISAAAANVQPGQPHHHHLHHQHQMSQAAQANAIRAQQLRPLVSGAHLALARHDILEGEPNQDAGGDGVVSNGSTTSETSGPTRMSAYVRAWSNLLQVTAEPSAEPGTLDRPTHLTPHPDDARGSMARQQLVSAAIWDAVGMPAMSTWATKSTLLALPDDLSYDDMITAIQNISRLALCGSPSLESTHIQSSTTAIGTGTGTTERDMNTFGKSITRPGRRPCCIYATAVSSLVGLRKELGMDGNDLEEPILQNLALTLHEWAVNRMEINDATALQKALNSYLHPGLANYNQFCVEIRMQQCLYYCRIRNWDEAKTSAKRGLEICKRAGFANHRARFLLQTSIIHLESNRIQCTTALPSLLEALTLCEERDMHGLHATGISILAQVFLRLCNPKRAISLLDSSIPTLLQREHVWFQAEAYRTLAKAHMNIAVRSIKAEHNKATSTACTSTAMATDEQPDDEDDGSVVSIDLPPLPAVSQKRYRKALQALTTSEVLFESCQDRIRLQEVLYLQSQIYDLFGDEQRRETTAERFLQVGKTLGDDNDDLGYNSSNGSSSNTTITTTTILDAMHDPVQLEALTKRVLY
jgi:Anaphase-promoting complex subunit 5